MKDLCREVHLPVVIYVIFKDVTWECVSSGALPEKIVLLSDASSHECSHSLDSVTLMRLQKIRSLRLGKIQFVNLISQRLISLCTEQYNNIVHVYPNGSLTSKVTSA